MERQSIIYFYIHNALHKGLAGSRTSASVDLKVFAMIEGCYCKVVRLPGWEKENEA